MINTQEILTIPPQIGVLQWLVGGSLPQNLNRALRLWVWLHLLYGDGRDHLQLPDPFTFADWRNEMFTATHPQNDQKPTPHDLNCRCQKLTHLWLKQESNLDEKEWRSYILQQLKISPEDLQDILNFPLFAVTRRSLQADLYKLVELRWVQRVNNKYQLVKTYPVCPTIPSQDSLFFPLLNEDLKHIAQNLSCLLNGHKRFFLDLDYVVSKNALDQVEDWQYYLKNIWLKEPIPPLFITYNSSRLRQVVKRVIYPICIYYSRRSVYLCVYGEHPNFKKQWCNYRLDRVQTIQELTWEDKQVPQFLYQAYQTGMLPDPEYIGIEHEKAWGFSFYLPAQLMILRFEAQFAQGYIQGSYRHATFTALSYPEILPLIKHHCENKIQFQQYQKLLEKRSPQDAYYQAQYRMGDVNVLQRLRAWRPFVEVLWPPDLRCVIRDEVIREVQFYEDNID